MVQVKVSRELVAEAIRQSNSRCGISLALKEAGMDRPRVTQDSISFSDPKSGQRYTYRTPPKIGKWIDEFDSEKVNPSPISFELKEEEAAEVRPVVRVQPSALIKQAVRDQKTGRVHRSTGAGARSYRPRRGD